MPKARRGLYTPPQHAPQLPNLTPPAAHHCLGSTLNPSRSTPDLLSLLAWTLLF